MVQVRWVRPQPWRTVAEWLDPGDHARLEALHREPDRDRSATGHALLRLLTAQWMAVAPERIRVTASCPWCGSVRHGRPGIAEVAGAPRPPHVSIAHAADRVAVALSDAGPVGVDLEQESATAFAGFEDVALAAAERAALACAPAGLTAAARARVWVRKEAALKATGLGLAVPLPSLTVTTGATAARVLSWRGREDLASSLALQDFWVGGGYAACVAVQPFPVAEAAPTAARLVVDVSRVPAPFPRPGCAAG